MKQGKINKKKWGAEYESSWYIDSEDKENLDNEKKGVCPTGLHIPWLRRYRYQSNVWEFENLHWCVREKQYA